MLPSNLLSRLRRSLLIKVIARQCPSKADIASIIELTASKLVEVLQAQSIAFYVDEGSHLSIRQIYYSSSLWHGDVQKGQHFHDLAAGLRAKKFPRTTGIVGRVIETGHSVRFRDRSGLTPNLAVFAEADGNFEVRSLMTVPLKTTITLGAIQVINKEESPQDAAPCFTEADLALLEEIAEYASALIHRMVDAKFQPTADDAARFIARLTELPLIESAKELHWDEALIATTGAAVIRSEGVLPHKWLGPDSVAAVMINPLDYSRREAFSRKTGLTIEEVRVISSTLFESIVCQYAKDATNALPTGADIDLGSVAETFTLAYSADRRSDANAAQLEREDSAPIIQLANRIIEDAYFAGASDIHVEPTEKELLVRYRIDGFCQDRLHLPKQACAALTARFKIMCNLDISECRLPQDGRIVFKTFSRKNLDLDLRVAVAPVNHGEKVVLRILDKTKSTLPLGALGFSDANLVRYRGCIRQPHGMILHCGPTGSGKSMTLYSALSEVNTRDQNVITAEDPIEYTLPGLNQTQMNRQIGLTFSRALRSFLRMDPDIILVGEIRDKETAQIAVEAALTGHLLVSTLSPSTFPPPCSASAPSVCSGASARTAVLSMTQRAATTTSWNRRSAGAAPSGGPTRTAVRPAAASATRDGSAFTS
jgi:type II secretory ATPase GspE/PulE/Tfp pilus assembly ATPase PilB-like protein